MSDPVVTRKDIARKAGVSVSVVSRALNNSGYVDKEKANYTNCRGTGLSPESGGSFPHKAENKAAFILL